MMANGDGFCFNSLNFNTEAIPAACENPPVSIPQLLQYSFGEYRDFVGKILDATLLTSCDDLILHGTFDRGTNPGVHLFRDGDAVGVVEAHIGIPTNSTAQYEGCGAALYFDGIVLDSWNLPVGSMAASSVKPLRQDTNNNNNFEQRKRESKQEDF